jgi:hypothetical protein
MITTRARGLLATAAVLVVLVPGTAHANGNNDGHDHGGPPTLSAPLAQGLAGPLQIAVDDDGSVYVAQDFAGVLTKIGRHGTKDIATNPGGEIAGVDVGDDNKVLYTSTNPDATGETVVAAALNRVRHGDSSIVADLYNYEATQNPDQGATYGFESIPADCAALWPAAFGPTSYMGGIDSHPYAVASAGNKTYVADAAGNAILAINRKGDIRTVAVLPPQPTVVSADAVTANGFPACVTGLTYDFEPVPTDVEVGHDGMLYVTTLPGGPEDPSLGARGSVYQINPWTGETTQVATGFLGATNLALGRHGQIFVSELFGGKISRVVNGAPETVLEVPSPAGLEYANGKLYVSYDVFANGSVATIRLNHSDD